MSQDLDTAGAVADYLRSSTMAQGAREAVTIASSTNPDFEADLRKAAAATGVPLDAARSFPDDVKRQAAVASVNFDDIATQFPTTAAFLADLDNARISHDDVQNLVGFEKTVLKGLLGLTKGLQSGLDFGGRAAQSTAAGVYGAGESFWRGAAAPFELAEQGLTAMGAPAWLAKSEVAPMINAFADLGKRGKEWAKPDTKPQGNIEAGIDSGFQSLGTNLAMLPIGIASGSATVASMLMAATAGGSSYGEARDKGASPLKATSLAVPDAVAEYVTEKWGMQALFDMPGVKQGLGAVLKGAANFMAKEIPGEQAATVWQDFNKWAVLNPEKSAEEFLRERPDAVVQTFIATLVGGGGQVALMSGMNSIIKHAQGADSAVQVADVMVQLNELADASKVLSRDATTAQTFFQNVLENEGLSEVWISAADLAQSGLGGKLASQIDGLADQISQAVATQSDVSLPVADLLAKFHGEELGALIPHLAMEPGGFTQTTAQVYMQSGAAQELQAEVEKVLVSQAQLAEFQAGAETVKTSIMEQLTTAGRFTPDVNTSYATLMTSFYSTLAARMGMAPEALFEQYPVNIGAQGVVGDQFNQMGELVINTPAFQNWFGDSKVVDAEGKPLMVYHETSADFDVFKDDRPIFVAFDKKGARMAASGSGRTMELYARAEKPANTLQTPVHFLDVTRTFSENPDADSVYVEDEAGVSLALRSNTQIKSATGNRGTFDPANPNILMQAAKPEGANVTTSDLDKVNPEVREAVEARIAKLPAEDQQRIRNALEEHKSTAWAAAAVKGMAYREMLERAMAGQDISNLTSNPIWGKQDMSATKLVQAFQKYPQHGDKILKVLMNAYDFIGGNRKAENDISTSFANCEPSKACAIHCYAAGSNARPNEIAKSEFTEFMIEHFPVEMTEKIVGDYMATAAGKAGLSLRLNDKGDLSPAQVKLIGMLNEKGVAVQVFSKRPELLRSLSDVNLKMLSIDGTNLAVAAANPDLRLAVTITDDITEDMLTPLQDRVSVYLPVNLKGQAITQEELRQRFPNLYGRMRKENLCPVDGGKLVTKPGTSFVDIKDGTSEKGVWTCTACDLFGAAGCFKGDRQTNQRKAQVISVSDLSRDLELKRVRKELQSNLDQLLSLGGIDGELHKQLSQALSSGKRAVLEFAHAGTEGGIDKGSGGTLAQSAGVRDGTGLDAVSGESGQLNQGEVNRGTYAPDTRTITLLKNADFSTFLHEGAHHYLELLAYFAGQPNAPVAVQQDFQKLLAWFGVRDAAEWGNLSFEEKRSYHEQFARGFEAYLFEGKAPSIEAHGIFQRFSAWLKQIYKDLKALGVTLTDDVRGVMDRMIATDTQIALAEQGRSMMPLFSSAQAAGMTPEEFAAYQATGKLATDVAIEQLQARGLRDMKWLHNARNRALKALQKEAKALREGVEMEVRREVMSQPVYQAWTFLTARMGQDDKLAPDLAREALAKAVKDWQKQRDDFEAAARRAATQESWDASEEATKKYRKDRTLNEAKAKVAKRDAADIQAKVDTQLAAWDEDNKKPTEGKRDPQVLDPSRDELLVAIAKLGGINRENAGEQLGVHKDEQKRRSSVFGKTLFPIEKGLTAERMLERLIEEGYFTEGADLKDLEKALGDSLAGSPYVSAWYDYSQDQAPGQTVPNPGGLQAGRLDRDGVRALGLSEAEVKLLEARRMVKKDGLQPDLVADLFGFTSGDELVRKLVAADPPKDEIAGRTDARMLAEHGDLATQEALEKAADEAIHNEARAKMVATEANALAKATGQRKILEPAARQFAAQLIARQRYRDIRPSMYATAAARASKAAEAASKDGNLATAAAEKRNQLINIYATKAAQEARQRFEDGVRYLRKFEKEGTRRGIASDYVAQIDALLEDYDLRDTSLGAIDRKASLRQWVEQQREMGLEPNIPENLLEGLNSKSWKELTTEEFGALLDTVKQIEHLGRLKNKLLTAVEQREYEAVRDEIVASIEQNAQGRTADTRTPTTNLGRFVQGLKRFWAAHIKVATLARVMDGGKDGGPVWEYLVRPANERADMETSMRAEATQKLTEILAPLFKLGNMGGKGIWIPAIGRSLNREARIAIALNTGNEGNLQRLMGGEGWNRAQVMAVLDTISAAEWGVVQQVWDHLESYRPLVGAKEMRVYGKEPDWVEAGSDVLMDVATKLQVPLRGGYYPIKYDPAASQRAEEHADAEEAKRQLQGAYTSATTRRSFTKSRAEAVSGRPLLYTLAGLYGGVNDVIHDLAWHEWLIDANRLIKSHSIDQAIRSHYGPEAKQQIKSWVNDVAEGERGAQHALDMALGRLRQGVSVAGLGFNVMSAMIQPLGITQTMVRIGPTWAARGVAKYLANPVGLTKEVREMSSFMENRGRTRFRELNELRNQVQGENTVQQMTGRYAFWLMMQFQGMVDVPTWWGAYEKAIANGQDEIHARQQADQAVIDSQGGGMQKDLSAIERGGPWAKIFTVFYSFMNTAFNLGVGQTMAADTPAKKARLAADYLLLYTVPAVLGYALKQALTPGDSGDDDPEKIAKKLLAAQIDYLMGMMVVVREFSDVMKTLFGANDMGRDYTGPAGLRVITDAGKLAMQAKQGEFDDAFRKALVNLSGSVFGLPSAQINRTITGTQALVEGKTDNPAAVAFGFQQPR